MQKTPGITAAPNIVKFKAKVLSFRQDSNFSDKWHLLIEILNSESIAGPNFARAGEQAEGFAFAATPGFSPENIIPEKIIVAEAEYVGDSAHGAFRINRIVNIL